MRIAQAAPHLLLIEAVFARADVFDVIHCHIDSIHFPLARRCPVPVVTTLHGRLDGGGLGPLHREFAELPLVSTSNAQRAPLAWASWAGTVHHGLPLELHRPHYDAGRYLVFLGRIAPGKRPDRAIAIARRAGLPLKIAARVDPADRERFTAQVEPLLAAPGVGTPVIAFACVGRARALDRRECRRRFERRFGAARMARDYCCIHRDCEDRGCRRRA